MPGSGAGAAGISPPDAAGCAVFPYVAHGSSPTLRGSRGHATPKPIFRVSRQKRCLFFDDPPFCRPTLPLRKKKKGVISKNVEKKGGSRLRQEFLQTEAGSLSGCALCEFLCRKCIFFVCICIANDVFKKMTAKK